MRTESEPFDLARAIATPALMGQHLGSDLLGGPYNVYPWVRYLERKVLAAVLAPGRRIVIVSVPPQNGKMLEVDTPIPTPSGWTTMGEVQVGDAVFGADGRPCRVTGVSAVEWSAVHRVRYDDGSTIDACADHNWLTFDNDERSAYGDGARRHREPQDYSGKWWEWESPGSGRGGDRKAPQVRTTAELFETQRCEGGTKANHSIPNVHPLELPEADLPVDPWLLGFWLGDGTRGMGEVTVGDRDVAWVAERVRGTAHQYGTRASKVRVGGLRSSLRKAGVLYDKRVPAAYLRASAEQRLALLQGLMDSDGGNELAGADRRGRVSFTNTNRRLVDAVYELAVSLGAKASIDTRPSTLDGVRHKDAHRVSFTPPFCPFRLPYKVGRWAPAEVTGRGLNRHHRKVVSVVKTGETRPMKCISVDGPGSLYLCGRQMIPTHNTTYFGLLLPMWYLGMNPFHQVIFVSYNEEQAGKWGLKCRDAMRRFGDDLFGVRPHPDSDAQGDWKLSNGFGGMMSVGWKGGITGNPGHLILADDLIKGDEDASSAAKKAAVFAEVQDSMISRFQKDTKMFLIATRWAEDDPSGRMIELSQQPGYKGIPIDVINIKAIAEPAYEEREMLSEEELEVWTDALGRREGEALIGQFDQDYYEERKATVESHSWYSLYQGEPTVREGGMFPLDRWGLYDPVTQLPDIVKRVRVWDMAASEGKGDYTVGTLMGRAKDGGFYVLDRERGRWGTETVERKVLDAAKRDGPEVTILIEEERNGAGKTVFESYRRKLVGYHVEKAKAEGSKESRATPYSNEQRKGNIYLPKDKPWLKEWREEHVQMDGTGKKPRHDDQIDTGAYAFKFLTESGLSEFWDPTQLMSRAAEADLGGDEMMEMLAVERLLTG